MSTFAFSEGNLTSLKVDSDIVYFSTDEVKAATSPSCMAAENNDKWSLSLNTGTGKAIYALLVTASADNRKITVESAGDCSDEIGFERAKSVELSSVNVEQKAIFKPALDNVAYGKKGWSSYGNSCSIAINSNDENGLPYLEVVGTHCQCNNGSKMVDLGFYYSTTASRSLSFACVIENK